MWPATLIAIYCGLPDCRLAGRRLAAVRHATDAHPHAAHDELCGGPDAGCGDPASAAARRRADRVAGLCRLVVHSGPADHVPDIRVFNVHQHGPVPEPDSTTEVASRASRTITPTTTASIRRSGRTPPGIASAGSGCSSAWPSTRVIDGVAVAASVVAAVESRCHVGLAGRRHVLRGPVPQAARFAVDHVRDGGGASGVVERATS